MKAEKKTRTSRVKNVAVATTETVVEVEAVFPELTDAGAEILEVQESVEITEADYTNPEQAADFLTRTGVDRLATVFGNIHGIVTKQQEKLDLEHFKQVVAALPPDLTLVLHGASGLPPVDVSSAIAVGINNVHINTELRVAYHDALQQELAEEPNETTPYKMLKPSFEASKKMLLEKLALFGSVNRL